MPVTKSPLRYPGGKTQLAKYIGHLMELNNTTETYIEPFAGGFGVALDLLFNNKVKNVVLNDFDPSIFSVWYSIINNCDEFIRLIEETPITLNEWYKQKHIHLNSKSNPTSIENGFSTFFLNRTNVSGIINGGPIGGKQQNGKFKIDCRFNKENLIKKIMSIHEKRDNISIFNLDANDFIKNQLANYSKESSFIFYDPPYFKQGKNLYLSFVNTNSHKIVAENIINCSSEYKWIVTYDIEDEIFKLYSPHVQSFEYILNYSANNKRKAKEFLFANNNTLVDSYEKVQLLSLI